MKRLAVALASAAAVLTACGRTHKVDGTVTVNGAPFVATNCVISTTKEGIVGALKVTHSVTLLDASHRTLEFNDDGGLSVEFSDMAAGKAVPFNVGRSCGKIAFSGPMDKPTEVRVTIDANCSGGGVVTRAKVTISDCGKTGLKIFP